AAAPIPMTAQTHPGIPDRAAAISSASNTSGDGCRLGAEGDDGAFVAGSFGVAGRSSVAASTGEDTFGGSTSAADSGVVSRASPSAASEPGSAGADASLDAAGLASEGGG